MSTNDDRTTMAARYIDGLRAFEALTADASELKDALREGLKCLRALRDVEGMSGRDIASMDGTPGTSQVARDLRAADFLADFPKADPQMVKTATNYLSAKDVTEARKAKNPPIALAEAAGLKKVERREPHKKSKATDAKAKDAKAKATTDAPTDPVAMVGAVEAIGRGFIKAIEAGEVDDATRARMRKTLAYLDQQIAGATAKSA